MLLRASPLVDALVTLFESLWSSAFPVAGNAKSTRAVPDESAIITLLAAGVKDEVIARQLGVSYSTIERRIRRLMDGLGAATRLQLGVRLAEHGLLDGD